MSHLSQGIERGECVAVCCSVLQCVAVCCSREIRLMRFRKKTRKGGGERKKQGVYVLQRVAVVCCGASTWTPLRSHTHTRSDLRLTPDLLLLLKTFQDEVEKREEQRGAGY